MNILRDSTTLTSNPGLLAGRDRVGVSVVKSHNLIYISETAWKIWKNKYFFMPKTIKRLPENFHESENSYLICDQFHSNMLKNQF